MSTPPTWDILMASIPHRHDRLVPLLAELDRQIRPGMKLRISYDNLVLPVGEKYRRLLESSAAEYVCNLEDDDWIAPDYVERITAALIRRPDYVGFPVKWTSDGRPMIPITHSLRYSGWENTPNELTRDIVQFNPLRRELADLGQWAASNNPDAEWAAGVRASGLVRNEAWIGEPMYYYQTMSTDTYMTARQPWMGDMPPLPEYPWLISL